MMKRVLCVVAVTAVFVAFVGSHQAVAAVFRVKICHVQKGKAVGHVIVIDHIAAKPHCKHGDNSNWTGNERACTPCKGGRLPDRCRLNLPNCPVG